jgi:hypothetical protein
MSDINCKLRIAGTELCNCVMCRKLLPFGVYGTYLNNSFSVDPLFIDIDIDIFVN